MINKQTLCDSMIHDCNVSKHLYSKLGPGAMDYRPTPGQRSTLELLRYLAACGSGAVASMASNDWDTYAKYSAPVKEMSGDAFPAAMEQQVTDLQKLFDSVSDEDFATKEAPMPGGGTMPLGQAILHGPAKWLTAYKMQLFLYAKAAGARDIGTVNAWVGMDPPPKE